MNSVGITEKMNLSDSEFIQLAYRFILKREPDQTGLKHYTEKLAQGSGRGSVLMDMLKSEEARKLLQNERLDNFPEIFTQAISNEKQLKSAFGVFYFFKTITQRLNKIESLLANFPENFSHTDKKITEILNNNSQSKTITFAVRITGGIGDAVIIARFVRDFVEFIDAPVVFDVYFHSIEVIAKIYSFLPNFRIALHDQVFNNCCDSYDFVLHANQFLTFRNESINFSRLIKLSPKVLQIYCNVQNKREKIEKYIENHPNLDGAFADLAVKSGHKRYTYLHEMAGIPYGGDQIPISIDSFDFSDLKLPMDYVTIHDGWDTKFQFKKIVIRPTKAIPKNTLESIVAEFKRKFPQLTIIQIGGITGDSIPGVDIDLKGKLKLEESIGVLSKAKLHIDSESGLVHIAAALGVKSVVLYGPTNMRWFSYPQNINIQPAECGNCWWSTDTWMEECPAEHNFPICMLSHTAEHVINQIKLEL